MIFILFLLNANAEIIKPINEKEGLTSSFAEWRSGHLHAGVDLPSSGIGEKIYSVSDGWVLRLRTSPWGYGKSIYIRDYRGYTFVYAHLSSFSEKLDTLIREEQLKRKSYITDLWPGKEEIKIKKDEIIGFTGRSGCMYKHLHFEMRDKNNCPVDPLTRGLEIPDTIPPEIKAIRLLPLDDTSSVNHWHAGVILENPEKPVVSTRGRVAIEVETIDRVNGHSGRLGPKSIFLYREDSLIREEIYDRFSYRVNSDSRFLFNYENRVKTGRKFRRLYTISGNDLPFYRGGNGIIESRDSTEYRIIVSDAKNNKTEAGFIRVNDDRKIKTGKTIKQWINPDKIEFCRNGIIVDNKENTEWIPSGKINARARSGDTIRVWNLKGWKKTEFRSPDSRCTINFNDSENLNSEIISVRVRKNQNKKWEWEPPLPLSERATLEFEMGKNARKMSIYELRGDNIHYHHTAKSGDKLITTIDHLGAFTLLKDSIPPAIELQRTYFNKQNPPEIFVSDSLSGIDFSSIITEIDGEKTVFRYDHQMKKLIHEYPDEIENGKHILELKIKDHQGNKNSGRWEIVLDKMH